MYPDFTCVESSVVYEYAAIDDTHTVDEYECMYIDCMLLCQNGQLTLDAMLVHV